MSDELELFLTFIVVLCWSVCVYWRGYYDGKLKGRIETLDRWVTPVWMHMRKEVRD